jgi:hypothetical protein
MLENLVSSGNENEFGEQSTGPQSNHGYEVGYGKPPMSTRFKKGVSGNPSGRPHQKHSHSSQNHDVGEIFRKVFATPVKANVGGRLDISTERKPLSCN